MIKIQDIKNKLFESMWFLPSILVLGLGGLAFLLLFLDQKFSLRYGGVIVGIFRGSASAARDILAAIAGSLITAISMAFSITIVAIQQASTQYSPRILRNFTKDKGNQIVLGTYLGTFIYSLLILRAVRSGDGLTQEYIPRLSISFSIVLALICSGLLIYFINHIVTSLRSETIISNIHNDLLRQIKALFPQKIGIAIKDELSGKELFARLKETRSIHTVKSKQSGFLRMIDEKNLMQFKSAKDMVAYVPVQIGDFISHEQVVFEVMTESFVNNSDREELRSVLIIGYPRSTEQDPLFSIRMLTDIALRALSPGINDPTTAEYCLVHLGDALCWLANREFPPVKRTFEDNPTIFIFNTPNWELYIEKSFSQIKAAARDNAHVTGNILFQLKKIASCLPKGQRQEPIRKMLIDIRESIAKQEFLNSEKRRLQTLVREVEEQLSA